MSVFLKNDCQYLNCGKAFSTLSDLIVHIENEHIDFDPLKMELLEEEPSNLLCVPMSYVLRFSKPEDPSPQCCSNNSEVANLNINNATPIADLKEEFSPDLLNHMNHKLFTFDNTYKKPFSCNMPRCQKRYKNVNGIKYHYKNYHKVHVNHTPIFKKSILKYKSSKAKLENSSLLNFQQSDSETFINNSQNLLDNSEAEPANDFLLKFINSSPNDTELPHQVSSNYYLSDLHGEMEDFAGRNFSNILLPYADDAILPQGNTQ